LVPRAQAEGSQSPARRAAQSVGQSAGHDALVSADQPPI